MNKRILLKCPDCKKKKFNLETGKCDCGLILSEECLKPLQEKAKKKQPMLVTIASVVLYTSIIFAVIFISVLMYR